MMFKAASHLNQVFPRCGLTSLGKCDSILSGVFSPSSNQCRTAVILRRKNPVQLLKKGGLGKFTPHKIRHKIYEVEDVTDFKTEGNIDVILKQFVPGVGQKGEVVNVRRSVAYNELLLPALAEYATPEALEKWANKEIKDDKDEEIFSGIDVPRTIQNLKDQVLSVTMNKETSWTIEPWHIICSFRKAGINIMDESCIEMPKEKIMGPNINIERKEFFVTVTINNTEKVKVRCRLHHWSTEIINRLPIVPFHWTERVEPLFEKEKEELASLPQPPMPKMKEL